MTFVLSDEAMARPRHTLHAAELVHSHASTVALECAEASRDDVVIAYVDRFLTFIGSWRVNRHDLTTSLGQLDDGGWLLVFSPGADKHEVEERSLEMARLSFKRWEALRRWSSKHPQ